MRNGKKIKGYILILVSAMLLSGCVKNDIKMSDNQIDKAAEYMAGVMLKYDKNYDSNLVEETETSDSTNIGNSTIKPNATVEPANNGENSDIATPDNTEEETANPTVSLSEVIGVKGCKISFSRVKILEQYEQENSAYIKAEKDKKIVVLEFKIKNTTASEIQVKLLKKEIEYALQLEDKKEYKPELSILLNDLQFYNEKIKNGKVKKAVLVFSVPKKDTEKKMKLQVTYKNKTANVQIK